jgi:hypothetical protein
MTGIVLARVRAQAKFLKCHVPARVFRISNTNCRKFMPGILPWLGQIRASRQLSYPGRTAGNGKRSNGFRERSPISQNGGFVVSPIKPNAQFPSFLLTARSNGR